MQVADAEEKDVRSSLSPLSCAPSLLLSSVGSVAEIETALTSTSDKQIAAHIKRAFDKRYGPTWHVVVGKSASLLATRRTLACGVLTRLSVLRRLWLVLHPR